MSSKFDRADPLWRLFERMFEGVLVVSGDPRRVEYVNPAAADCFKSSPEQLRGQELTKLISGPSAELALLALGGVERTSSFPDTFGLDIFPVNGQKQCVTARFCLIPTRTTELTAILLKPAEVLISSQIDPLTKLDDRDFLERWLTIELRHSRAHSRQFAVLFVDLDNFKAVNDEHGHLVGDRVLQEAALRLKQSLGHYGSVVRYGGDEFVVLINDVDAFQNLDGLIDDIRQAFAAPFTTPDGEVKLSLSVGTAICPGEFQSPQEVIAAADRAMYAAKRAVG